MKFRSKTNLDVKQYARKNGVFLWQIADVYEISVETFNRRMRYELNDDEKKEIMSIIDDIANKE